jgi:aryl-alcohol dehydrogenase-like predicted oxidoreductase
MEYRQLGRSGLMVSTVTLGTMGFGGTGWASPVGHLDVKAARQQIDICLEAGVNLIDTADVYSSGLSEEILGEALGADRADVLIATKVRGAMGPGPNDEGLSRHHVIRAVEASLRRLGTDYIDLYQVHEWDGLTPQEETLSALDALVQSGKVRYIGSSNYTARQLMKALWISDRQGYHSYVSQQIYYSLQARDAENELRRLGRSGGPCVHAGQARRHLGHHRCPDRGAAPGQPRRRRAHLDRRAGGAARHRQWRAAALPLLASGERAAGPVQPGGPEPDPAASGLIGRDRPMAELRLRA